MGNLFFIQTMKFRRSFSAIANSPSPSVLSRPILSFFPPLRLPEKKEEKLGEFLAFPDAKKKFPTRDHRDKVFDSIRRNVQHVQHLCLPQRTFITINSSSAINRRTDKILHRGKKVRRGSSARNRGRLE